MSNNTQEFGSIQSLTRLHSDPYNSVYRPAQSLSSASSSQSVREIEENDSDHTDVTEISNRSMRANSSFDDVSIEAEALLSGEHDPMDVCSVSSNQDSCLESTLSRSQSSQNTEEFSELYRTVSQMSVGVDGTKDTEDSVPNRMTVQQYGQNDQLGTDSSLHSSNIFSSSVPSELTNITSIEKNVYLDNSEQTSRSIPNLAALAYDGATAAHLPSSMNPLMADFRSQMQTSYAPTPAPLASSDKTNPMKSSGIVYIPSSPPGSLGSGGGQAAERVHPQRKMGHKRWVSDTSVINLQGQGQRSQGGHGSGNSSTSGMAATVEEAGAGGKKGESRDLIGWNCFIVYSTICRFFL